MSPPEDRQPSYQREPFALPDFDPPATNVVIMAVPGKPDVWNAVLSRSEDGNPIEFYGTRHDSIAWATDLVNVDDVLIWSDDAGDVVPLGGVND